MVDWLDEVQERLDKASPAPWPLPEERIRPGVNDPRTPLDHEGCDVWPWHREEDMLFAYKAREDVPRLLAIARVAEALAEALAWIDSTLTLTDGIAAELYPQSVAHRETQAALARYRAAADGGADGRPP